jgi:hypothetical protein
MSREVELRLTRWSRCKLLECDLLATRQGGGGSSGPKLMRTYGLIIGLMRRPRNQFPTRTISLNQARRTASQLRDVLASPPTARAAIPWSCRPGATPS